jgi:hypothetical protein
MSAYFYRGVFPPDTNVRMTHFLPGGLEEAPTRPCEGHLYRAVTPTDTNALICTGGKIPSTNEKSSQGQMLDSLVVTCNTYIGSMYYSLSLRLSFYSAIVSQSTAMKL